MPVVLPGHQPQLLASPATNTRTVCVELAFPVAEPSKERAHQPQLIHFTLLGLQISSSRLFLNVSIFYRVVPFTSQYFRIIGVDGHSSYSPHSAAVHDPLLGHGISSPTVPLVPAGTIG